MVKNVCFYKKDIRGRRDLFSIRLKIKNNFCVSPRAPYAFFYPMRKLALDVLFTVLDDYTLVVLVNLDTHDIVDRCVFVSLVSDDVFNR